MKLCTAPVWLFRRHFKDFVRPCGAAGASAPSQAFLPEAKTLAQAEFISAEHFNKPEVSKIKGLAIGKSFYFAISGQNRFFFETISTEKFGRHLIISLYEKSVLHYLQEKD